MRSTSTGATDTPRGSTPSTTSAASARATSARAGRPEAPRHPRPRGPARRLPPAGGVEADALRALDGAVLHHARHQHVPAVPPPLPPQPGRDRPRAAPPGERTVVRRSVLRGHGGDAGLGAPGGPPRAEADGGAR